MSHPQQFVTLIKSSSSLSLFGDGDGDGWSSSADDLQQHSTLNNNKKYTLCPIESPL